MGVDEAWGCRNDISQSPVVPSQDGTSDSVQCFDIDPGGSSQPWLVYRVIAMRRVAWSIVGCSDKTLVEEGSLSIAPNESFYSVAHVAF